MNRDLADGATVADADDVRAWIERTRNDTGYEPTPPPVISPQDYARVLSDLGLPADHRLTVGEFAAWACRTEADR
jgi:hypothetical protein